MSGLSVKRRSVFPSRDGSLLALRQNPPTFSWESGIFLSGNLNTERKLNPIFYLSPKHCRIQLCGLWVSLGLYIVNLARDSLLAQAGTRALTSKHTKELDRVSATSQGPGD